MDAYSHMCNDFLEYVVVRVLEPHKSFELADDTVTMVVLEQED